MALAYADDMPYWKTSERTPADTWLDKAKAELVAAGATITATGYAEQDGRASYLIRFTMRGEAYRLAWPVLPTRSGKDADRRAARVQAATMLFYDCKTRGVAARVHGARAAYLSYLELPDGRSAAEAAAGDLVPPMLLPPPAKES
jgi:hypothetical protein